eukprot:3939000-Pleurochrysis_carterae.AAC.1
MSDRNVPMVAPEHEHARREASTLTHVDGGRGGDTAATTRAVGHVAHERGTRRTRMESARATRARYARAGRAAKAHSRRASHMVNAAIARGAARVSGAR